MASRILENQVEDLNKLDSEYKSALTYAVAYNTFFFKQVTYNSMMFSINPTQVYII